MFLNIIKSECLKTTDAATVTGEVSCESPKAEISNEPTSSASEESENKMPVCEPTECSDRGEPCDPNSQDEEPHDGMCEHSEGETPCEPVCNTCYPNEQCNYLEWVYVLLVNGYPDSFFEYKCNALRVMRERARNLCLQTDTTWTYSLARHVSDDRIDVVRRLKNFLITYDQVMTSLSIHQVFKKKHV